MADNITLFQEAHPSLDSYWRSVILFGRNVASYKFALAKSLLEIAPTGKSEITLEELADPFSRHLCEHIAHSPRQVTSPGSGFLDTCRSYNDGTSTHEALLSATVKNGFNNVIDAFHIVNNAALPVQFYTKDYCAHSRRIILTDEIFKLQDTAFYNNFAKETESRWRLVETAWEQNISAGLLDIQYSELGDLLYIDTAKYRRKTVTSARAALNGYQKGKCFYCFDDISIGELEEAPNPAQFDTIDINTDEPEARKILRVSEDRPLYGGDNPSKIGLVRLFSENEKPHILLSPDYQSLTDVSSPDPLTTSTDTSSLCDVDHFFPYTLQRYIPEVNLNGIWNLVLTCRHCNRGEDGKSAKVPAVKYLERLHARNEFLINSHHPLRETLIHQTGAQPADRIAFLKNMDAFAINNLIHRWEVEPVGEAAF